MISLAPVSTSLSYTLIRLIMSQTLSKTRVAQATSIPSSRDTKKCHILLGDPIPLWVHVDVIHELPIIMPKELFGFCIISIKLVGLFGH